MKKQKYYLAAGVLACSAISGLAMPLANTFAEGDLDGGSHDVTVGEVDEPIYSVDIEWNDMVFDWKYNAETNEYNFESPKQCVGFIYSGETPAPNMFSDNTCSSLVSDPVVGNMYYSKEHVNDRVGVFDESENGRIKAQVSFVSEPKYSWIVGTVGQYIKTIDGEDYSFEEYDNGILPVNGDRAGAPAHYGHLKLVKNVGPNNPVNAEEGPITQGEKIGTVTITIEPDLN